MAPVAFIFAVALQAFGLVVISLKAVAVSPDPCKGMGLRLYLGNIVMADGTLSGRFTVVMTRQACFHRGIIVFFKPLGAQRFRMAEAAVLLLCIMFDMRELEFEQVRLHCALLRGLVAACAAHVPGAIEMALPAFVVQVFHARDSLMALGALLYARIVIMLMVAGDA